MRFCKNSWGEKAFYRKRRTFLRNLLQFVRGRSLWVSLQDKQIRSETERELTFGEESCNCSSSASSSLCWDVSISSSESSSWLTAALDRPPLQNEKQVRHRFRRSSPDLHKNRHWVPILLNRTIRFSYLELGSQNNERGKVHGRSRCGSGCGVGVDPSVE